MTSTPADANLAIEVLKALPTLLVTLFLGGLTVRVAQEQKRIAADQRDIARRKLNLDLFERRLKVFEATWAAASAAVNAEGPTYAPPSMTNLYPEASFLFGPEVEAYMKEVAARMTALAIIRQLVKQRDGYFPPDRTEEHTVVVTWLSEAATTGIREVFAPYLDFSRIR